MLSVVVCSIEGRKRLLYGELSLRGAAGKGEGERCFWGGAPAARGSSIGTGRRLLLRELPLRGAAGMGEGGCCFGGSSRCAGLLYQRKEEAACFDGDLPLHGAAGMGEGGGCILGSSRCAGPLAQRKRLLHGDLPLPRCAQLLGWGREEAAAFGGSSRCAGLLDWGREDAAFGGARRLLRGSSRRAGLLDRGREEAAPSGGAPAARGCSTERGRRLILGEIPLRGAARQREGGGCSV